jgi:hypothetical protein
MKEGDTIAVIREENTDPTASRNTRLIAAALASGAVFPSNSAFLDTVEQTPQGPHRTVRWLMDGAHRIEFDPISEAEQINMAEFRRRFESRAWCEDNPNHPIAYMRAMTEHYNRLIDKIKTMRPMILIRKGKRVAIVPSGSDAASVATREQILAEF